MKVREDTIRRMVLSKSLFREARAASNQKNDRFIFARGILLLHDAVESALGAVADHLHATIKRREYLLSYFDRIEDADPKKRMLPHRRQILNLNEIRNGIKHHGILPDPAEASSLIAAAESLMHQVAQEYLGLDYVHLSLKDLIRSPTVKTFIAQAEDCADREDYEDALIALAYAIYHITESSTVQWFTEVFKKAEEREPILFTQPHGTDFTVTLLEHGVDPFTYYRFRNLTPKVGKVIGTDEIVYHWDKHYGHRGNWTRRNVQFCLDFCVDTALKFEKLPSYEYDLLSYQEVFEDVITPVGDKAVFWNRAQKLADAWPPQAKAPPREPILELQRGQSISGFAYDDVTDLSEWRVVSYDLPRDNTKYPGHGFVAKDDVQVRRRDIANSDSTSTQG